MRKKLDKPAPLSSVLQDAMRTARIDLNLEAQRVWRLWPDVVGPAIAQNTRPEAIKGKLLIVNVSSAPWIQQLQFLKSDLIEKLNESLGEGMITDIRFKIGPLL